MSIRFKMTTIVVAVVLVANSLLSFVTLRYLGSVWLGEVQTRVQRNLNSARAAYEKHIELIAAYLKGAARDGALIDASQRRTHRRLNALLADIHEAGGVDFVTLLDPQGRVMRRARSQRAGRRPGQRSAGPQGAVRAPDRHGNGDFLPRSPARRRRGTWPSAPASNWCPRRRRGRRPTRCAVTAWWWRRSCRCGTTRGQLLALLYGGDLLNRRYDLVDTIKRDVFPLERYRDRDIGTVTIFQGDLRISTNVTMEDGTRAVGTRLSETVCEAVLDRGGNWAAPAFVVNDWYITAYEPIRDPTGNVSSACCTWACSVLRSSTS